MKKILFPILLLFIPSVLHAATAATQLEGGFKVGPAIILIIILVLFVVVGIVFRAKDTTDFYAAGREISKVGSGMAIASNWMSAASFLGMAASCMVLVIMVWPMCRMDWRICTSTILMAGQIRKYGKYTAADFIGDVIIQPVLEQLRGYYCHFDFHLILCRTIWRDWTACLSGLWELTISWAVIIGGLVVLTYTLISGMLGVTKNMQIQYVIIIHLFLFLLFILTAINLTIFGFFLKSDTDQLSTDVVQEYQLMKQKTDQFSWS